MKVLVSTDGSAVSWTAAAHAARFARVAGADLVFTRILDPLIDVGSVLDVDLKAAVAKVAAEWRSSLEAEITRRGYSGEARIDILTRGTDIHDALIAAAADTGAGLIAMHSRGHGALRHAILGSVAMGVLGRTTLPLMVTGAAVADPDAGDGYRIALMSDGSDAATSIANAVATLIAGTPIALSLGQCVDGKVTPASAEAHLGELRALFPADMQAEIVSHERPPKQDLPDAIVAAATEVGAQAIALSSQGHGALRHLIAGSVALDVVSRSPLPVILARA
ncbi:MAG TPA: universal stress protein [Tepidiformaceae bacterium]|nr:universal stress protein [Tepidiformaceae bacterium]